MTTTHTHTLTPCQDCQQTPLSSSPLVGGSANHMEDRTMTYSKACEILGFTTPKSLIDNARLAKSRMSHLSVKSPLKYKVACSILIRAAEVGQ